MRKLSYSSLNAYLKNIAEGGRSYRIMDRHSQSTVFVNNKPVLKGDNRNHLIKNKISGSQLNLYAQVSNSIEKYLLANDLDIPVIKPHYSCATVSNRKLWNSLKVGQEFYYVDVKHCFWRIAYLRGYIHETLYDRAANNDQLKQTRNKALSCIVSPTKMSYFDDNGKHLFSIVENRNLHQTIYNNIRFTSYNIVAGIYHKLPKEALGYRIDAVLVFKDGLQKVKDFFETNSLFYDVARCVKKDDACYINTVKMEEKNI